VNVAAKKKTVVNIRRQPIKSCRSCGSINARRNRYIQKHPYFYCNPGCPCRLSKASIWPSH